MESSIQYNVLLIFVLCLMCGFSQSEELNLKVEPRYLQFNPESTNQAQVMCTLQDPSGRNVPLAGCQFVLDGRDHIWEFNMGPASPRSTSDKWPGSYHGRGLQHGECGITLTGFSRGNRLIVGCRVRPVGADVWIYEKMMVYAHFWAPVQFHLQPQVTLAKAGTDVTFNGAAELELGHCFFWLPPITNSIDLDFDAGLASAKHSRARYHGDGLQNKQCGIHLSDVQPQHSGFVRGRVWSQIAYRTSMDFVTLIVLTAPEAPPILNVITTGLLASGSVLHATCVVKNSRPVAKITWFLGDNVIRNDNINEAPLDSKWRWDHDLQTNEQHLEHVVTLSDNGKQLKCKASHVALASGSQFSTSHFVLVKAPTDPCLPNPCGDNSVCHVIRDEADCNCKEHFIGSPPSCRPECSINEDCTSLRACVDARCVDPCSSISCGDGAQCHVAQHVAECKCLDGLFGDPLIGCKAPTDPCLPNPCGDNSVCHVIRDEADCNCKEHFIGSPPSCRPECSNNEDCTSLRACVDVRCVDPCSSRSCGDGAQCHVAQHVADCKCLDGLVGDPLILCKDPCQNNPCGVNGECYVETSVKKCRCQEHFVGDPPFCRPECSINDECSSLTACVDARCVDPCNSTSCGDGAQCHVAQHVAECM